MIIGTSLISEKGQITIPKEIRDKLGIVQRLAAGEDIELIVQDNLLTILSLSAYGEGHIVED